VPSDGWSHPGEPVENTSSYLFLRSFCRDVLAEDDPLHIQADMEIISFYAIYIGGLGHKKSDLADAGQWVDNDLLSNGIRIKFVYNMMRCALDYVENRRLESQR
jgi:hypothetical protein